MHGHVRFLVDGRAGVFHGLRAAKFGGPAPVWVERGALLPLQQQVPRKTERRKVFQPRDILLPS
jgi:hypothetical protein